MVIEVFLDLIVRLPFQPPAVFWASLTLFHSNMLRDDACDFAHFLRLAVPEFSLCRVLVPLFSQDILYSEKLSGKVRHRYGFNYFPVCSSLIVGFFRADRVGVSIVQYAQPWHHQSFVSRSNISALSDFGDLTFSQSAPAQSCHCRKHNRHVKVRFRPSKLPLLRQIVLNSSFLRRRSRTIEMIDKIYQNFDNFVDAAVEHKSRSEISKELAEIAGSIGLDKEQILNAMFSDEVTQALKYHTRHGRQMSVHVTPSVFVNGITLAEHSSSWTIEDWAAQLDPLFL